jgi:hypothetical protein
MTHENRRKLHLIQLHPNFIGLTAMKVMELVIDDFLRQYEIVDPWEHYNDEGKPKI